MKRKYSLKGATQFKEIYQKGRKFQGKGIQIFVIKKSELSGYKREGEHPGGGNTKIGLSLNKKMGKAHTRNLIKRRLRSMCMELIKRMNTEYCIIIRPVSDIQNMEYGDSKKALQALFTKAGILE